MNRIYNQEIKENDNLFYTDTDLEHDTVYNTEELENNTNKNLNTLISETKYNYGIINENLIIMIMKDKIHKWKTLLLRILMN